MTRYLLALSLGPVQSLIGAARRTRDLWCGSWLLSEAARAAARELHKHHPGCLIFPPLDALEEPNVSNILRAEVAAPDAEAVRDLCQGAKDTAAAWLVALGENARKKLAEPLREDVWSAQVDTILECYAAWVPLGEDYGEAGRRLGRVLAARKATRDFRPCPPLATAGLPKSSLDGAFETVLPKPPQNRRARRKLGLSDNEQLDALGVMKRMAGDSEQFTAYSRIAADPWIEESLTGEQRHRLRQAYKPMVGLGLATRVGGNDGAYRALPYDAQLLYPSRLDRALSQTEDKDEEQKLRGLQECVGWIGRGYPVPYAAILKADGDRMGQFLSKASDVDQSRMMSRALQSFASRVREVVQHHRGHAIYAGGDDVLALVPLARSIRCAEELAAAFKERLASVAAELNIDAGDSPTLSVGLGLGHFMEPLGALRARAEEAERLAKGSLCDSPRNALAIVLGIRSGGEHRVRLKWDDAAALNDLRSAIGAFRDGKLPSRIAYDLRGIDRRLWWLRGDSSECANGMRNADICLLLDRARTGVGEKIAAEQRELIERRVHGQPLAQVADLLIVARWLSARVAAELGER